MTTISERYTYTRKKKEGNILDHRWTICFVSELKVRS